ncbi:hypothetical protein B0H10DRAFT_2448380 [Mycena sp. CBHHK59/15]|nr:hypothetical protein B0H10DRAFT_2448380 [Mycena sp. CBHHK59/15]
MHLLLRTLAEDIKKNENVQEIVDGVGSYDELASLVVKQISLCVAYPEEQMRVLLVADILQFLTSTCEYDEFTDALLLVDMMSALVAALDALFGTAVDNTWPAIRRGLGTLITYLATAPMYPWIAGAVKAGLLRFIVSCAIKITLDKYFPRRERAFIRALLDADYKRLKPQISRDVILFMHAYPNTPDAYFVHFDYTHFGRVAATVRPRSDLVDLPAWYRRTRLHVVFAARGKGPMPDYLVPLLSSSTAFDAGLHRIASEIPAGADIWLVENKVWELIQATMEMVEIHQV